MCSSIVTRRSAGRVDGAHFDMVGVGVGGRRAAHGEHTLNHLILQSILVAGASAAAFKGILRLDPSQILQLLSDRQDRQKRVGKEDEELDGDQACMAFAAATTLVNLTVKVGSGNVAKQVEAEVCDGVRHGSHGGRHLVQHQASGSWQNEPATEKLDGHACCHVVWLS